MADSNRSDSSSRALVDKAIRGDTSAIDSLMKDHLPALRAYVRLRAGHVIHARESDSDIVQSVCREALQELREDKYRTGTPFRQWLFTLAFRKMIDRARFYRRRGAAGAIDASAGVESPDYQSAQLCQGYAEVFTPSRHAMQREEAERVERAFDRLEDSQREILLLSRVIGLSRKQIAEQTGHSEESVKKLLARAVARLSVMLEGPLKSR